MENPLEDIEGYDPSYVLEYYNIWTTYEEHGWFALVRKNGILYSLSGGYSVMDEGPQDDKWNPEIISDEEAISEMEWWDENSGWQGA